VFTPRSISKMIAIIVAIRAELRPLLRRLAVPRFARHEGLNFYLGNFAGREVIFCASGIGIQSARDAADVLLSNYSPEVVVCAGVAGALIDAVKFGDIIIGTEIFQAHLTTGAVPTRVFVKPRFRLPDAALVSARARLAIGGGIVTSDRVATTPEEKRAIFDKTAALAVEMETAAIAQVAFDRRVKFLAVRAISDDVGETLPAETNSLHRDGKLQWGRVAKAVVARPSVAKEMARLGKRAAQAADVLAKFLECSARDSALTEMAAVPLAARPHRH
jgi:nucleoside phosphorylase